MALFVLPWSGKQGLFLHLLHSPQDALGILANSASREKTVSFPFLHSLKNCCKAKCGVGDVNLQHLTRPPDVLMDMKLVEQLS